MSRTLHNRIKRLRARQVNRAYNDRLSLAAAEDREDYERMQRALTTMARLLGYPV